MPRYFFTIAKDDQGSSKNEGLVLASPQDAWTEATMSCGEMIRELNGSLRPGSNWQMTVSDESGKDIFRLAFVSEAFT